ncbi:MAG: hypothetical protein AMXMBFR47_44380 [Planctomycetota bacterium]
MPLQITTLLLVLGVTFLQSVFGFFSGLINLFCTVTATVVAFGFYEALTYAITGSMDTLSPAYVEPCALVGLFLITLTALRYAADNLIRGNVTVPPAMDWAGAGICGFLTSMLTVGTLTISLLMLPIGGTVMGFNRYERTEERGGANNLAQFQRNSLWVRCDEFTVGFFNIVSGGSMRGGRALSSVYPDFPDAVFFSTNTVQMENQPSPYREKKVGDGFMRGLAVVNTWKQKNPVEATYRAAVPTQKERTPSVTPMTYKPESGKELWGFRLALGRESSDRDRKSPIHMFRPTAIRLVGKLSSSDAPRHYVPVIVGGADGFTGGKNRVVDYDVNFRLESGAEGTIDVFFEVDPDFQPEFIEYRRHCRVAAAAPDPKSGPPTTALRVLTPEEQRALENQGNRTFGAVAEGSDNAKLPFNFLLSRLRANSDCKLQGDKLVHARIWGEKSRLEVSAAGEPGVTEFQIPEGKRILQVRYRPKEAASIVGQVFNYVGSVVNQYYAQDDRGGRHALAGYYAIVKRGNNEYVELFFNGPESDPLDGSFRQMLDFKEVKRNELNDQDDSVICLIFLVDPGVRILRIQNQAGDGGDVSIPIGG